jgi:3-oxoacyl-[acyl-carrier protein] reductase
VDVVVHNAGITRTSCWSTWTPPAGARCGGQPAGAARRPPRPCWTPRRAAPRRRGGLRELAVGIAGNRGQTNYAASKAGVIGMVGPGRRRSPSAARRSTRWRRASSSPR